MVSSSARNENLRRFFPPWGQSDTLRENIWLHLQSKRPWPLMRIDVNIKQKGNSSAGDVEKTFCCWLKKWALLCVSTLFQTFSDDSAKWNGPYFWCSISHLVSKSTKLWIIWYPSLRFIDKDLWGKVATSTCSILLVGAYRTKQNYAVQIRM